MQYWSYNTGPAWWSVSWLGVPICKLGLWNIVCSLSYRTCCQKRDIQERRTSSIELFEVATRRDEMSDKVRTRILIYIMGHNASDIYESFKQRGTGGTHEAVKKKFKEHFKGKNCSGVWENTVCSTPAGRERTRDDVHWRSPAASWFVQLRQFQGSNDAHSDNCWITRLLRAAAINGGRLEDPESIIAEVKAAELTKEQDEIMQLKPEASISAIRGR